MHGHGDPQSPTWGGPPGLGWIRAEEPRIRGRTAGPGGGKKIPSNITTPKRAASRDQPSAPLPSTALQFFLGLLAFSPLFQFLFPNFTQPVCLLAPLPAGLLLLSVLCPFSFSSSSFSPSPALGPCSSAHPADAWPAFLQGFNNNWLRVVPRTRFGAFARGAKVVLYTKKSGAHLRIIDGGSGYLCEMEPVAHFGLGESGPGERGTMSCGWDSGS